MEAFIIWITSHIEILTGLITALLILVEKVKAIPWHPVTSFFSWLGKKLNTELRTEVSMLSKQITVSMDKNEEVHCHVRQQLDEYNKRLVALKRDIDENEKDRIKQIIFHYGAVSRNKGHISIEEFRYIQDIYYKYHGPLNGNGKVTEEYELISSYFNNQQ